MTISTEQLKAILADYARVEQSVADAFVNAFIQALILHLKKGEEVEVQGLGTFYVIDAQMGELRRWAFRPDDKMKDMVNAPFSYFEPIVIGKASATSSDLSSQEALENKTLDTSGEEQSARQDSEIDNSETEANENKDDEEQKLLSLAAVAEGKAGSEKGRSEKQKPAKKTKMRVLIAIVIAVFLLATSAAFYWEYKGLMWQSEASNLPDPHAEMPELVVVQVEDTAASHLLDTVSALALDSTALSAVDTDDANQDMAETVIPRVIIPSPDPVTSKTIVSRKPAGQVDLSKVLTDESGKPVTVTLGEGERLTLLALQKYGDKSFWSYIYEVNRHQLKNPNVIPIGTVLYLPDPQKFGIDSQSGGSLSKAWSRGKDILDSIQ